MFKTQQEIWAFLAEGGKVVSKMEPSLIYQFKDGALKEIDIDTNEPNDACCIVFVAPQDWAEYKEPIWYELENAFPRLCKVRNDCDPWVLRIVTHIDKGSLRMFRCDGELNINIRQDTISYKFAELLTDEEKARIL